MRRALPTLLAVLVSCVAPQGFGLPPQEESPRTMPQAGATPDAAPDIPSAPSVDAPAAQGEAWPVIESLSATAVRSGDRIELTGRGFGAAPGHVRVSGALAELHHWTPTKVTVVVPRQRTPDCVVQLVTAGGEASSTRDVTVYDAMRGATGAGAAKTFVSLTFDDSFEEHYAIRTLLNDRGIKATFYVNSTRLLAHRVGETLYMTQAQALALQDDGHEIGGHTLHHFDLTTVGSDEVRRQACDDRARLLNMGLAAQSFAYPLGATDDTVAQVIAACGYRSARITGHSGAIWPLQVPPPNPFMVPAAPSMKRTTTLDDMKAMITSVESAGGGWVPLVFHRICDDACSSNAVTPGALGGLLDWLVLRESSGTVARTMRQMIGGSVAAAPGAAPVPPTRQGNLVPNASLEEHLHDAQAPDCWVLGVPGGNLLRWSVQQGGHGSGTAMRLSAGYFSTTDRRLNTRQDAGECSPPVVPGVRYVLSAWYTSDQPVRLAAYFRDAAGFWRSGASSPSFPGSATWTQAVWVMAEIPEDVRALGMGVRLDTDGSMSIDDFSLTPLGASEAHAP